MATLTRRRNRDGSTSWDAMVRIVGYPTVCKSFPTKVEATLWASRTEAAARGRTLAIARETTLRQLIEETRPRLKRPREEALGYWSEHLGHLRLLDVTPALLSRHRDLLLGALTRSRGHKRFKPRSAATTRHYLAALSSIFRIAIQELRLCDTNPVAAVRKPPASRWRTRFLSDGERCRLLDACRESTSKDLYLAVLLSLTSGLRRGELHAIRWRDVDLERRWVVLPRTKNGDARGIPMTQTVVELLRNREAAERDRRVFECDLTKAWRTALARADIHDFRWHDLRHSAASTLVQNGANISEVAALLGHRGIQMTSRYAHVFSGHTLQLVDRVMGRLA